MTIGMCTIVSKNYISLARTLVHSFLEHHPNGKAFVLLVDRNNGEINVKQESFEIIELNQIQLPREEFLCFKYNITELNTAVKPFFMEYLFKTHQIDKLLYFDPDILIMQPLDTAYDLLSHFSIVLTPHILSPINDDQLKPSEIDLMQAGAYNLGFIGLSKSATTFRFLSWWKERLYKYCFIDFARGLFVDQKWIDLVPGMFENTYILRDYAYNVAYWNLHERKLDYNNKTYYVNGKPLVFYHFSGFNIDLKQISKHQNRFDLRKVPNLYSLFNEYKQKILSHDFLKTRNFIYTFDYFDNQIKIPDIVRKIFISLGDKGLEFGNPFYTNEQSSYYRWLIAPIAPHTKIPRLIYEVYSRRPDLKAAFPNITRNDELSFIQWAKVSLNREYNIDKKFLDVLLK